MAPVSQPTAGITAQVVRFTHYLRSQGIDVTPVQTVDFVRCLPLIGAADRSCVRDAARAIFVRQREQLAAFEAAFERFWSPALLDPGTKRSLIDDRRSESIWTADRIEAADLVDEVEVTMDRTDAWSAAERLRLRDFGDFTAEEANDLYGAMRHLARRLPVRRSRRLKPAHHGRQLDVRSTLRASLHTAGDPVHLSRRQRDVKRRPLVLLCDVSGSMERYARILLQFAFVAAGAHGHLEAFVFATQLTRVSDQLRPAAGPKTAHMALDAAVAGVRDWGSGTRIGACLQTLRTRWPQVLDKRAIIVMISDGCDRGNIPLLAQELAALQCRCYRLIWLNPWLGQEGYQPSVRGMQAAMPHVDQMLPIHNLASLEQLVDVIADLSI